MLVCIYNVFFLKEYREYFFYQDIEKNIGENSENFVEKNSRDYFLRNRDKYGEFVIKMGFLILIGDDGFLTEEVKIQNVIVRGKVGVVFIIGSRVGRVNRMVGFI